MFSLVFSLVFLLAKDVANIKKLMAAQQQEDEQAQAVADEASGVRPLMRNKQTKKHKTNAIHHFLPRQAQAADSNYQDGLRTSNKGGKGTNRGNISVASR